MREPVTAQTILEACRVARRQGQYIEIDWMLPSILYHRDADNVFHLSEDTAIDIFDLYRATAEQTGVALRDVLLWAAQNWQVKGTKLVISG